MTAVFCDFDGTITQTDLTDAVLASFALPAFEEWEYLWRVGKITSQECLSRQVALLRADRSELIRFAADFPIDEGIFTLEHGCAKYKIPLTIVSDGFDLLIDAVLRRHGLSHLPVFSSRLEWHGRGQLSSSFPYAVRECRMGAGTCKCALITCSRPHSQMAVYIGDGQSDYCVAARAQRLFAKGALREWCEHHGVIYEPFETLTQVAEKLFSGRIL